MDKEKKRKRKTERHNDQNVKYKKWECSEWIFFSMVLIFF